ncbi:MAG: hypothetical protein ACRDTC_02130 [Pseudonocardiaceae bacterium]
MAGASALWRGSSEGLLHGVLVWALSVVTILIDPAQAIQAARELAGWGALCLGLSAAAAGLSGRLGSKLWPGRHNHSQQSATVS